MRKGVFLILCLMVLPFILISCGGGGGEKPKPVGGEAISTPWDDFCTQNSNLEGGLAACKCVWADDLEDAQIQRDAAVADARSELTRMLEVRVATMVKRYKTRVKAGTKKYVGTNFEEVAKQVAYQYLKGSRPIKFKTFRSPDGKYVVCAVVALQPEIVKGMISEIAKKFNSPQDEEILYQEFKAFKAQQELEKEIQKENQ